MKLINIDASDLHNETLASDDDYARIRVGLLRDLKLTSSSYKGLVKEYTALSDKYDSLANKYMDTLEMERIQRNRANRLEATQYIKLDIQG